MILNAQLLGTLAALTPSDRVRLRESSQQASTLESVWKCRFQDHIEKLDEYVFRNLYHGAQAPIGQIDFLGLVLEHSFDVMNVGMESAKDKAVEQVKIPDKVKLSFAPGPKIPKSFAVLKELYDKWKRGKDVPQRQKIISEKLKKAYIQRCQSIWDKYGAEFREGKEYSREKVSEILKRRGDMAKARADTIVQTETTYYYNKARRVTYDRSPDVSHYLFIAIRDQATTKWCKTRQGLVYAKGDPLLEKETPPIHWNCRSEMVPLTELNPRHKKLIDDKSRARRNNTCEPLPKGWSKR